MFVTIASHLASRVLRHPLFHPLDKVSQEKLLAAMREYQHPSETLLIRQGEAATHFFMVLEGRVKLFRISVDGQEKVVEIIQKGKTFAEAVMFMQHLSVRLHMRLGELETLTLQNATQRFTLYLIQQLPNRAAETADIDLMLPKHLIAARLSMQPETLSRLMARLRDEGLITITGRHIHIPSISCLLARFNNIDKRG